MIDRLEKGNIFHSQDPVKEEADQVLNELSILPKKI
jgi:hypothetical protein